MDERPSSETNRSQATQEIPRILWKPKVHHRIQNIPPPIPILCQVYLVRALQTNFSKIHFNIILSSTPRSFKWSPYLRFPH
jgi:hypothetical protein